MKNSSSQAEAPLNSLAVLQNTTEKGRRILSQVLEQSPVMVIITDIGGAIVYVNCKTIELTGFSKEELIGSNPRILSSGERPKEEYRVLWETISSGKEWRGEFHNKKKNGEFFWSTATISAIFDTDGNILHYISYHEDITERKQAEQEIRDLNSSLDRTVAERTRQLTEANKILQIEIEERKRIEAELDENREKYRGLSEAAFDSIFFSEKGICIEQNQMAEKVFGYTTEEALGRYGTDWIVPSDRKMVMDNMLAGYEEPYQVTALKKDGTTFPCMLNGKMMHYKGRNVRVTSLTDITERRLAEEAVQAGEYRFATFMDYLPALVFIKDHESKMIYANNAIDLALGASKWIGLSLPEIFDVKTAERIFEDDEKTRRAGYQKIEESFQNLDGSLHHYETQKFLIPMVGRQPLLGGIAIDVTGRRQTEAEIVKARNAAVQATKAKSEFLSRMSHELRTPLNSILGFAQLMDMGELDPKLKKQVRHMRNSGNYLLKLIDEVLDISRIEAGGVALSLEPVKLAQIILEMTDCVHPQAMEGQLTIGFVPSPADQLYIEADIQRLKQVLLNLLSNAIKYNRPGGTVKIECRRMAEDEKGIVPIRISITNTGEGISTENLGKLFSPFERIGAEKTEIEGTGLGLTVVKKLMDAMRGTIGVESTPGKETTFWIELPMTENLSTRHEQKVENKRLSDELNSANNEISCQNEEKAKRAEELLVANKELIYQNEEKAKRAAELAVANTELAYQNDEKAKRAAELILLKKEYLSLKNGALISERMLTSKTGTVLYIEDNIPNTELVEAIIENHFSGITLISSFYGKNAVGLAIDHKPDLILLDLDLPDTKGSEVLTMLKANKNTEAIPVVIITADASAQQIENLMLAGASDYLTKPIDVLMFLEVLDEWVGKRP